MENYEMDYFNNNNGLCKRNKKYKNNQTKCLPIAKYQDWFDVIAQNRCYQAEEILRCSSAEQRDLLINAPFDYEDKQIGFVSIIKAKEQLYHPFHLAVALSSREIVELMINNQVDITGIENKTCHNVLHSCVTYACVYPELEPSICGTVAWLKGQIGEETMFELLNQENKSGFRPIEYAAQQGCLQLMKALLETMAITKSHIKRGMSVFQLHDITDYECGPRNHKSPISMLPYLDKEKLRDPVCVEVLNSQLVRLWVESKQKRNTVPFIIWIVLRLSFLATFFIADGNTSGVLEINTLRNVSSDFICPELNHLQLGQYAVIPQTAVLIYAALSLLSHVMDIILSFIHGTWKRSKDKNGKKNTIANTQFFNICNLLLTLLIGVAICFYNALYFRSVKPEETGILLFIINLIRCLIPVLCLWNCIYFLQLTPSVGVYVISVQGMVIDLFNFLLLFGVVIVPFVHAFESFVMVNSRVGCVDEFSSPYKTAYTLFQLMLSEYDTSELNINSVGVFNILRVLFTCMVGIMLLNFLIAIMSNSASKIADNGQLSLELNRLAMSVRLEDSMFWCSKWLYRWLNRRAFHCHGGRVYLVSETCRLKDRMKERTNS